MEAAALIPSHTCSCPKPFLQYITTMFDDLDHSHQPGPLDYPVPPIPKYLIIDFTLVSGMDTSAIDLLREIVDLCVEQKCRLSLAGIKSDIKSMLLYAGLKVEPGSRRFIYVPDLARALAKAEDNLITTEFHLEEKDEMETSVRKRHRGEIALTTAFSTLCKILMLNTDCISRKTCSR
jgi:hypothetical protein